MADHRDEHEAGSAAGGEAVDLDALAKRYLDLWEDQLRQLSSDPEVARAMARTVELMNAGATAFAGMVQAGMQASAGQSGAGQPGAGQSGAGQSGAAQSGEAGDEQSADAPERATGADDTAGAGGAGTAAAGDASGGADVGVGDLARRVAVLEQRIADLEAALDDAGASPRPRSRRRRS